MSQEVEFGFIVCRGKNGLTKGPTVQGTPTSVDIPVDCPGNSIPLAVYHSHPNGNPALSRQDIIGTRKAGLAIACVKGGNRRKCYRLK